MKYMQTIGELDGLSITGGQILSRIEAKTKYERRSTIRVLTTKAICDGTYNESEITYLDLNSSPNPKRIAKKGDIVIKLSTPYDACIVEDEEGFLIPSFCAIVNNIPDYIYKTYLLAFFNSESYKLQVKELTSGANIAILNLGQLNKIKLPVPDIGLQKDIGDEYIASVRKNRFFHKIMVLEKEYNDSTFFELED